MLLAAERPLIYAGGGVHPSGAHDALAAVADYLQAGVVETAEGKGAVSEPAISRSAPRSIRQPAARYVNAADVVLVVGSRVALAGFGKDQQLIQIDIDPDEIGRNHAKTFGLSGDAQATLEELVERLRAGGPPRPSRKVEREGLRAEIAARSRRSRRRRSSRACARATPEDAIFVADMTQIGYYSRPVWPVYRAPHVPLTSSYSGNLGYAYPVALGAKVACPDRPVIAIFGDGGFFYNVQELSTAVRYGINVVAVVFNDNAYGNVARDLDEAWGGRTAPSSTTPTS